MSTADRHNLLDYLPPEERQKVLTLVQRLKEETEQKQRYKGLYEQSQSQLNQMTLQCNQVKDENKVLKEQIHNSFSIVAQVRASFKDNQRKRRAQKNREDQQWEEESEEQNEENHKNVVNQLSVTNCLPPSCHKSPLEKYRPPMTTSKKTPSHLNISSCELNKTSMGSSRSKELNDLKKEIQEMQLSKKKDEQKKKQTFEKMRLVDEIKNRYRSGDDSSRKSVDLNKQTTIERIDITHTFENQERGHHSNRSKQKVRHKEQQEEKPQTRQLSKVKQKKQSTHAHQKMKSPSKGYVVTADDYDDVLSMINCNN